MSLEKDHKINALIVDDHPIIADAMMLALTTQDFFEVIYTADSIFHARKKLAEEDIGFIILDLNLADSNGTEGLQSLRENYPDIPVVVYSGDDSEQTIVRAFEYGVRGFVPKSQKMPVVISAIKIILAGGNYIPDEVFNSIGLSLTKNTSVVSGIKEENYIDKLTPRQKQVFKLLLQGMPNKIIADRLDMAEGTVKTHLNTIYRVMGVNSRAQAIIQAKNQGLI